MNTTATDLHAWVSEYYGKLLASTADLKTNACCATGAPPARVASALMNVHDDVQSRFYGCGFPIPDAVEGCHVLDLGCGTGRDAYVLAQLVGKDGHVTGVDMTDEQLRVAQETQAWHAERFGFANTRFVNGFIEDLTAADIADGSVDVVVSNCVVNLSPRKDLAVAEAFRVLRDGGEFYLSDVVVDRRLPAEVAADPILYGECLGGAMYRADFEDLAREVGFTDVRVIEEAPITIQNAEVQAKAGLARFASVTYRLFKLPGLDTGCEDYGQVATYRGGVSGSERLLWLDDHHAFEVGRPERVCRNTARMLSDTRFAPYFDVSPAGGHLGAFPCDPTQAARLYTPQTDGGAPVPSGGCCG